MSTIANDRPAEVRAVRKGRSAGRPSQRNCRVYERAMLDGDSYEAIAADYSVSRQRIATIVARVEGWIADHPRHELAQKMRVRCGRRWEAIWSSLMESFDRSRQDRRTTKERTARRGSGSAGDEAPVMTVTEHTVREQNGDPRFLHIATRVADRQDRLWMRAEEGAGRPSQVVEAEEERGESGTPHDQDQRGRSPQIGPAATRFPHLPGGLGDLEHLAYGLRNATEAATANTTEGVSSKGAGGSTPVSTLFEQRCAEAFRCLGFDVQELGQGCGRVADCLAVATAERFAVVIDAKVRRRGYTLGTDDRQFCEYATRHTRELALSGIDKVYFAVIGSGFRQEDLDKLARFMTGTPIRSVCFIEAQALMRMVDDSIRERRKYRLADMDQLLFGNKIIDK